MSEKNNFDINFEKNKFNKNEENNMTTKTYKSPEDRTKNKAGGMSAFIEHYARISDMGEDQVIKLLQIQDKTDTKYSRVKTCKELWDIQNEQIQTENERLSKVILDQEKYRQSTEREWKERLETLQGKLDLAVEALTIYERCENKKYGEYARQALKEIVGER